VKQAATIQRLSAGLGDVSGQAHSNAAEAGGALQAIQEAGKSVTVSVESMKSMLNCMADIKERSTDVSKVIKVIDDIAFQTNILALNAAVEAARAGAHGKGFSVVSDEVRNLASKSAEAAKETSVLIEGSVNKVNEGGEIAVKTNESMNSVAKIAQENAVSLQSISASSESQRAAIDDITKGVTQLSEAVQSNAAVAEQSAATAEQLAAQAQTLTDMLLQFKFTGSNAAKAQDSPAGVK
jgi:methyl-accepting chemotaxis protein